MKILWLAHDGNMSGANICLLEYIQILTQNEIENFVIVPFTTAKGFAKAASAKGIIVSEVKFFSWTTPSINFKYPLVIRLKRWFRNHLAIRDIVQHIKKIGPDFIVTNTITTPVAALAAKIANIKHIWFVHEFGEEDHGFSIAGGFFKGATIMNSLSYKMVFNSIAVQQKYNGIVPDKKKYVVFNPVVLPLIPPRVVSPTEDNFKLIMLGQVAVSKNHIEALNALKICKKKGLSFTLSVVGKAEDLSFRDSLIASVESFGLKEQVKFLGLSAEPAALLQQHHVLLMCSKMEAFGRVTVEAIKLGIPVIAANQGGSLEIVEDSVNGYLYESGNAETLADKILLLHNNYKIFNQEKISKKANEKFSEINTYKQLLKVFC